MAILLKPASLRNFNEISGNIMMKLINVENNKELLKNVPHFYYLDLAIIFYYRFDDKNDNTLSFVVTEDIMENWGVEKEELYKTSVRNTKKALGIKILSLEDLIMGFIGENNNDDDDENGWKQDIINASENNLPVYVLTNNIHENGAINMLFKDIGDFADILEDDLFIIPSSIHEVLLMPVSDAPCETELCDILNSVNEKELSYDEILSDHIYTYIRNERRIVF